MIVYKDENHKKRMVIRVQILLKTVGKKTQEEMRTNDELNVINIRTCEINVISN